MRDSVVDRIEGHADVTPGQDAITVVHGAHHRETLTYRELVDEARLVAAWLADHCSPGDRALLLYPTSPAFAVGLLGCLYAGVTAVPAPLPVGHSHHLAPATGIALDSQARVVLTEAAHLDVVAGWLGQDWSRRLARVATDRIDQQVGTGRAPPAPGAGQPALLHYTFGPAGQPKGIMVGHENLHHSVSGIRDALGLDRGIRVGGPPSMHHGIGLVGLVLAVLACGGTSVLIPPSDLAESPLRWLELVHRCQMAGTIATATALEQSLRSATDRDLARLDLSRLRFLVVGSQPPDAATLGRFTDRFAGSGLRPEAVVPWYGPAEATSFVSAARLGTGRAVADLDARALRRGVATPARPGDEESSLVRLGTPSGVDVRVVGADATVLPDGRVGEIWIRGGGTALGYWRDDAETRRVFDATTACGERGFLRTGDLGFCHRGGVYLVGRLDDMLVVDGRRVHPRDVEREVTSMCGLVEHLACGVFAVPDEEPELVLVQEVPVRCGPIDLRVLARRARSAIAQRFGLCLSNVTFVRPGQVRRAPHETTGSSLLRALFMADALDPLYEELSDLTSRRYRMPRRTQAPGARR